MKIYEIYMHLIFVSEIAWKLVLTINSNILHLQVLFHGEKFYASSKNAIKDPIKYTRTSVTIFSNLI